MQSPIARTDSAKTLIPTTFSLLAARLIALLPFIRTGSTVFLRASRLLAVRAPGSHLQRPHCHRSHIHAGAKVPGDIPRFRCAKPVSLALVDDVIQAPCGLPCIVVHAVAFG